MLLLLSCNLSIGLLLKIRFALFEQIQFFSCPYTFIFIIISNRRQIESVIVWPLCVNLVKKPVLSLIFSYSRLTSKALNCIKWVHDSFKSCLLEDEICFWMWGLRSESATLLIAKRNFSIWLNKKLTPMFKVLWIIKYNTS